MKTVGLLPARMESTRLPGKALMDIHGYPAIVHTYKRCKLSKKLDDIFVATDSIEIKETVEKFGGKVILTGKHRNGSERIHEAAKNIDADIIININGDEVLINPQHIDSIIEEMTNNRSIEYAMGVTPFSKTNSSQDIKGVIDLAGNLIFCSRADIPSSSINHFDNRLKMVFITGFTPKSLNQYINWEETPLEIAEPNEFLRILEHGHKIKTVFLEDAKISLDTQSDLEEIKQIMQSDHLFKSKY